MKLTEGQVALDFTVKDINGNEIRLSKYKGKKIILGFFRNVGCPFCNRRIHEIMSHNIRLKKSGVELLIFFESKQNKITQSTFHKGIEPWPIISDPEKTIYNLYGVEESFFKAVKTMFKSNVLKAKKDTKALNLPEDKEASAKLIPADFFIDENFKIIKANYGNHIDDHVSMEELKQFAGI